jgi:two-component system LytT family response regulator
MPPVVFVTAFDEYAVKAFDLNAVDFLLKPFDQSKLERGVARLRERLASADLPKATLQLQALLDPRCRGLPDRIVVRKSGRYEFVAVESIDWIESANNYVQLHCGTRTHLLSGTLAGLEKKLDPRVFVRIHRGRIVNASRVVAVYPGLDETYALEMNNGIRLSSGKQFKKTVQKLIGR